ncbi:MAG: ATP synthase F0 subunit B [bacterium]
MKGLLIAFINFVVFAVMLVYFTRKKVAAFFSEREKKLRNEFEGYRQRYDSAQEKIKVLQQKLDIVEEEKNTILAQYKEKSEAVYRDIIESAKKEAGEMQCECGKILEAEIEDMKKKIISDFTDSVLKAVESRTAGLSEDRKNDLKKEFIELLNREK